MSDAVAKRSDEAAEMLAYAEKGLALMGGTDAMRKAGKVYLPKFEAESETNYDARLNASWLFNGYRKTVRDMTGRVFDKPVELGTSSPQIEEWCMNADMQGRDLSTFARAVFEDGLSGSGVSYVMVDAPARYGVVTQAQAQQDGLRPYFVHLTVSDVLGWQTTTIGNKTVLSQLRIMETVFLPDPLDEFAEVKFDQVRVLDRLPGGVQVRLYRRVKDRKDAWVLADEPTFTGLPEITVIPFYANRAAFFTGAPLLDDLADVNIAHWQSQSDQRNILHYARVPILFAAGRRDDESAIVIGAGSAVTSDDPAAKLSWVEHSGAAIEAGRQDLKDLESQMEAHGLQLLATASAQSATGEALDSAKETSQLAMTADALKDCLEQALIWMGEYGGLGDTATEVKVNKEFGAGMMTAQEMTVLLSAVNTGNLSRETFLGEMSRRKMIAPDTNAADEAERIDAEGGGMDQMANGGQ